MGEGVKGGTTNSDTVRGALPRQEYVGKGCPLCGTVLARVVGVWEEHTYDAVRCPRGCDLWELYG